MISQSIDVETFDLIQIFLASTLYSFKSAFYEKTKGTTTGSSLSLIVASIFMEHFNSKSLK